MRQSLACDTHSPLVIEAAGLTKQFGRVHALNGLDLEVPLGEVHGFLGPNGSGKSTTIRALLGQIRLDGGRARVFGRHPWRDAAAIHTDLAYVPGDVTLWPNLTGGECIDVLGRFQGEQNRARKLSLIERFQFDPTRRTRTYSKGNRQKVALIAALATEAPLLMLDEPTSGLDPLMEAEFQSVVRDAADEGRTVLLSSHILSEVEALCDRVSIVRDGRTVRSGSLADLRGTAATTVEATLPAPPPPWLVEAQGVTSVDSRPSGDAVRVSLRACGDLGPLLQSLLSLSATALVVTPPSLDDLFLTEYAAGATNPRHAA